MTLVRNLNALFWIFGAAWRNQIFCDLDNIITSRFTVIRLAYGEKWVLDDLHIIKDAWRSLSFFMHEHNALGRMFERTEREELSSSPRHYIMVYILRKEENVLLGYFLCSVNYITPAKPHFIVLSFLPSTILHEIQHLQERARSKRS